MDSRTTETSPIPKPKLTFSYNDEIFINYDKIGNGKKCIIFLHGFGLSLFSWTEVNSYIDQKDYSSYLIDLKGFGFSYKGKNGTYSVSEQAAIIKKFIQTNRLNNIVFVGHSYGGMVALYLLFQSSIENMQVGIEKLILLDTPAFPDSKPFFLKALRNPILNFIGLQITSARTNAIFTIRNTFYDFKKGIQNYLGLYEFFFRLPGAKRTMTLAARNIYPSNISGLISFYSKIYIPTLIIWGKNDKLIPLTLGEKLQNVLGNANLVVIDQCGHVPNEECPEITAKYINDFLMK